MIALSIMVNGIAYSGVVQNVSKLACTIFCLSRAECIKSE